MAAGSQHDIALTSAVVLVWLAALGFREIKVSGVDSLFK